jgi:Galactose oxidase, central domain
MRRWMVNVAKGLWTLCSALGALFAIPRALHLAADFLGNVQTIKDWGDAVHREGGASVGVVLLVLSVAGAAVFVWLPPKGEETTTPEHKTDEGREHALPLPGPTPKLSKRWVVIWALIGLQSIVILGFILVVAFKNSGKGSPSAVAKESPPAVPIDAPRKPQETEDKRKAGSGERQSQHAEPAEPAEPVAPRNAASGSVMSARLASRGSNYPKATQASLPPCGAYDSKRDAFALIVRGRPSDTTKLYEWRAGTWTKKEPKADADSAKLLSESTLTGCSLVYDPSRDRFDLFLGGSPFLGGFPVWAPMAVLQIDGDGDEWAVRRGLAGEGEPVLAWISSVYDPIRRSPLVIGVPQSSDSPITTWEWDTEAGSLIKEHTNPRSRPPWRGTPAVAYDSGRKKVVMFGGQSKDTLDELWEYDTKTSTWRNLTPREIPSAGWPSPRHSALAAYDQRLRGVIVFGGWADRAESEALTDAWMWDGKAWRTVSFGSDSQPPSRFGGAAVSTRTAVMLFGGLSPKSAPLDDLWLLR